MKGEEEALNCTKKALKGDGKNMKVDPKALKILTFPRVVVSTAAFHAIVRGSVAGLGGLKETKNISSPSTCETQYCGEPP